jgi:tetratricopeptide (TPR) repeat protein
MKKILLVLCVFCAGQLAAQTRAGMEKKLAKSESEIVDPKKSVEPKTWINRGSLMLDIYEFPIKDVMQGMSQLQIKTVYKGEKVRTDIIEVGLTEYEVLRYADKKLYFDEQGLLAFWEITDPLTEDPLIKSFEAYSKAYELDAAKKNTKKIKEGFSILANKLNIEASISFGLGKYKDALHLFEVSLNCTGHPAVGNVDTVVIYNTAIVANLAEDSDKAAQYYKKSLDIGYDMEGATYAGYAEALMAKGDTLEAKNVLTQAIVKYPENQAILIHLINIYLTEGSDLSSILPYIKQAQENDPTNASLHYVEGTIYEKMNNLDMVIACYEKAMEVDPTYFPAYFSMGALHFNMAVDFQDQAGSDKITDEEYNQLVEQMEAAFEKSIPYFTRAHELNAQDRVSVESLKNIYFRFRMKSQEMMDKYEYYTKILDTL